MFYRPILLLLLAFTWVSASQAGLIVTVEDPSVSQYTPGVTFSYDVSIKTPLGDPVQPLALFDILDLSIFAANGVAGVDYTVEVVTPSVDYIFGGVTSGGLAESIDNGFFDPNETLVGFGDFVLDVSDAVDVDASGSQLLAQINVTALKDVGEISILPPTSFDVFLDSDLSFTAIDLDEFFSPAPISASSTNVIPEPASFAIWATMGLGVVGVRRRKRG